MITQHLIQNIAIKCLEMSKLKYLELIVLEGESYFQTIGKQEILLCQAILNDTAILVL